MWLIAILAGVIAFAFIGNRIAPTVGAHPPRCNCRCHRPYNRYMGKM